MYIVLFVLPDNNQSSRPKHVVEIQGIDCSPIICVALDIKILNLAM
jgi:hypothetical protein